jgi:two-component system sensor histidine kinase MtrB
VAIGLALLGTVILGWVWGRSLIPRIFALTRVTRAIADGRMDERVVLTGQDEIRQLGDAFNSMADRLVELQEEIRKQERQAMFARVAKGLVHDLNHPLQRIGPAAQVLSREGLDPEERRSYAGIVQQNLRYITRFMNDILNMASPQPIEHVPVDVNKTVPMRPRRWSRTRKPPA